MGPFLPTLSDFSAFGVGMEGRLCASCEGGGKRRIFAIGNYVNQQLLKPVHDWLMTILSHIEMDGTFNQIKPLMRLVGKEVFYCYDFKSATGASQAVFFL